MALLSPVGSALRFRARDGLVRDRFHFDQQVRVRQLADCDGGSRGALFVEKLSVNLVVSFEILHFDEKGGNFDQVFEVGIHAGENVADIFNNRASLLANVQMHGTELIGRGSVNGIVSSTRTGTGDEKEIACALYVRELAAWLGFAFDNLAFHFSIASMCVCGFRLQLDTNIVEFGIKI